MTTTDGPPPVDPDVRQRSTRDRPAKSPLSEAAVIDAALSILRSDGLDAVTMRRVAAALDTGAASLYVYVSGRDALLQAMLDRVVATIELEVPDPTRWRTQLHSLLSRMRQALLAHPGIAAITLVDPVATDTALFFIENLMEILLAGGLSPQDAAWGCDVVSMLTTAAVIEDDERRARGASLADRQDLIHDLYTTFSGLSPDRFPALSAHATEMVTGDGDERFRFAIDLVVDGMVARAARR